MQKKIIGVVGSGLSSLACISRLLNDPEVSIVIIDDSKDDNSDINSNLKVFKLYNTNYGNSYEKKIS